MEPETKAAGEVIFSDADEANRNPAGDRKPESSAKKAHIRGLKGCPMGHFVHRRNWDIPTDILCSKCGMCNPPSSEGKPSEG
jgi:hypothetical protein